MLGFAVVLAGVGFSWPMQAWAQREAVDRAVIEVALWGDETALVHLGERVGAAGIRECLDHAPRSGRITCARAGRYVLAPWSVLPVLAEVLDDHDRQVASLAAESMNLILEESSPWEQSDEEISPEQVRALLDRLRSVASNSQLSPDVRARTVSAFGLLARLVGADLDAARAALADPEVAVQRAAVAALTGSTAPPDVEALARAARAGRDLLVVASATAALCEVTLRAGRPVPDGIETRFRQFLEDRRARPSLALPLLACIARSPESATRQLRALAARHPNEATRAAWNRLTSGGGAQ